MQATNSFSKSAFPSSQIEIDEEDEDEITPQRASAGVQTQTTENRGEESSVLNGTRSESIEGILEEHDL